MIQFDEVSLSFAGEPLFEKVSFSLQKEERCSFVGRNGSGKSTLFRLIAGEIEPDQGSISIPKDYRIGYLSQHIRFTEPTLLEEAALGLQMEERDHLYKAEKILFGLGFTEEDLEKSPEEFSGGFHLRLHLAKVLIARPNCLLLDEPTNYLDILSIRWLEQFLKKWGGEFMIISHEREFLDSVSTHTMGIHRGIVKKIRGSTINFFEQILLEEEVHEKTRVKLEKRHAHARHFVERFGATASKAKSAQSRIKMMEREPVLEKLNALSHLSFHFHEAPMPGRKMVDASDLQFSYTEEPMIQGLSVNMEKGQRMAIIGKNGRGKSTLLRLLARDLEPQGGVVDLSDNVRIGYFGQTHIGRLNPEHKIDEEISLANPALNFTQVKGIAGTMLFSGDLSLKKISVLSGGEKSRVLLAKILAKPCNLLLLDEPTHHLDIESVEALIDALEDFSGSVVIVTHSELILRRLELDQIIICEEAKQTLFLGGYDLFLEKMGWEEEKKASKGKKPQNERKERAEEVAKNAALLRPLEKNIQDCEKKIIKLEEEQKARQKIVERGKPSPELLKALGQAHREIESLYQELEKLHTAKNNLTK
jgi:ATP-binding cassette subfamily F protein 3